MQPLFYFGQTTRFICIRVVSGVIVSKTIPMERWLPEVYRSPVVDDEELVTWCCVLTTAREEAPRCQEVTQSMGSLILAPPKARGVPVFPAELFGHCG